MASLKCDSKRDSESWLVIRMTLFLFVFMTLLSESCGKDGVQTRQRRDSGPSLCEQLANDPKKGIKILLDEARMFVEHEWYEQQGYKSPYTVSSLGPLQFVSYSGSGYSHDGNMTTEQMEREKKINATFNGMIHRLVTTTYAHFI